MAIFNRKSKDKQADPDVPPTKKEKVKFSKRPANTAFKQQRLKAWQPILTPKAVLPTLFIIGLIFAPIGALIVWGAGKVTTITLDYTQCDSDAPTDGTLAPMSSYYYALKRGADVRQSAIASPTWSFSNDSSRAVGEEAQCEIEFEVPYALGPGVFLYYKLTNYYQNHRRYVQSLDTSQLTGHYRSTSDVDSGDCKPITSADGKPYYPCGLIANSLFNVDTFSSVVLLNPTNGAENQTYNFTEKGIAWSGIAKNYVVTPDYSSPSDVLPPPNWARRYPNNYTEFPNLRDDEHFQVWMRVAALPTFRKLWARNDNEIMSSGRYRVVVYMNYPVKNFTGTKSIVISTVSWIGGRQPFLGWAYIAASILCVLLALAGLIRHLVKPRKLGDMSRASKSLSNQWS
ncbi:ligand-effect modulator 3 family [Naematelia encephala]|uniref:Ligand-effect modulator 3 family n=1 Tax=Naematelia encephala TaxID=71784 RepID=A0A1Y2B7W3_9TREE|nr:ligand-effect modulator 3 family [Naematelia encephala]